MPELPEVQTTVNGIKKHVVGHTIKDVWSDYSSAYWKGSDNIKDIAYFEYFKKEVVGKKILSAERRAKNILIHLSGGNTILIHMKMTGHVMYGSYEFKPHKFRAYGPASKVQPPQSPWLPISPPSLKDPFNRHVHFVITLDGGMHLALCDSRKFAKVTLLETKNMHETIHLKDIGPEPLSKEFTFKAFIQRLNLKPHWQIKLTLLDQSVIAGIGNIYADESLWHAGIHPKSITGKIPKIILRKLYVSIRSTLSRGIDFGGDSMSDYRNILGERGKFQDKHMAYKRKGERCMKRGCRGTIRRIVVGSRGTHFCDRHQTKY